MSARDTAAEFSTHTCSAPAARSDRMRDIVVQYARDAVRVLDLGCGTGSLVLRLAEALPQASVTGIDVSRPNIEAAIRSMTSAPDARVRFELADYRTFRAEPFDAIVADGVLHLIPGRGDALVEKIASDLRPGGRFICSMPFDCTYNRAFSAVRRLLRAVRSSLTDRAILQVARWVHGGDMDESSLRERVGYMYLPPFRVMDDVLARQFAAAGLTRLADHEMASTSPSQLKHSVTIWQRSSRQ